MWFSKVTRLGAVCNTTTSFDEEPYDHQKEGWCPRVVESDREIACSEHFGGTGKKRFTEKKKIPNCIPNFTKEFIIYKSKLGISLTSPLY